MPGIGRFASADSLVPSPADPQSFNRYSYVYNNPLNATDPTGHFVETVWDAANIADGEGIEVETTHDSHDSAESEAYYAEYIDWLKRANCYRTNETDLYDDDG